MYRKKLYRLLGILFLIGTPALAQEANNWYFGLLNGLRLNFNTSPPSVSNGYPLVTEEGSAAISDASGNPLFYTDGMKIWDASTNTTFGTGLMGGTSSTQSAIIIPKPGAANQWFLFTSNTDPNNGASNGIHYYTVSGSPGTFSISAATQIAAGPEVGEGLCILASAKPGDSYWVISHERAVAGSRNIRAYSVSNTGIVNSTPQLSSIAGAVNFTGYIGSVKANTCQNKIAFTYYSNSTRAEVYDFNNTTGNVTALVSSITIANAYGIEFSPNDQYLYISQLNEGTIHQHNIAANTTYTEAAWDRAGEIGQLQLAPDGKIYAALHGGGSGNEYLGVINAPDLSGNAANYVMNGLLVTTQPNPNGFVFRGLPTFSKTVVAGILQSLPGDGQYCVNTPVNFSFTYTGTVTSIDWDWGDGTIHGTSNAMSHTYTSTGTMNVVLTITDGCGKVKTDNFTLTILDPKAPSGIASCSGSDLTMTANGAVPGDYPNYVWYNSSLPDAVILGIGSPVTFQAGSSSAVPSEVCVKVAGSASVASSGTNQSIGATNLLTGAANATPYTSPLINVLADVLVLKSFDVKIYPACSNANFTVTIQNGSGTTIYTSSVSTGAVCGNYTVNVNAVLPKGNGYKIILTASPFVLLYRDDWRGATNPGQITYVADPLANSTSIANLKYDYNNYAVTNTCSNTSCYPVSCSALPVALTSFEAVCKNAEVFLSWSTATGKEDGYFEIQSSSNGQIFETIGKINGAGTSFYTFTDRSPFSPVTYYRLIQHDEDGSAEFSSVKKINTRTEFSLNVYPNPTTKEFTVHTDAIVAGTTLMVLDIFGRVLYQDKTDAGTSQLLIGSAKRVLYHTGHWFFGNH